jgi:hypothetical protein
MVEGKGGPKLKLRSLPPERETFERDIREIFERETFERDLREGVVVVVVVVVVGVVVVGGEKDAHAMVEGAVSSLEMSSCSSCPFPLFCGAAGDASGDEVSIVVRDGVVPTAVGGEAVIHAVAGAKSPLEMSPRSSCPFSSSCFGLR